MQYLVSSRNFEIVNTMKKWNPSFTLKIWTVRRKWIRDYGYLKQKSFFQNRYESRPKLQNVRNNIHIQTVSKLVSVHAIYDKNVRDYCRYIPSPVVVCGNVVVSVAVNVDVDTDFVDVVGPCVVVTVFVVVGCEEVVAVCAVVTTRAVVVEGTAVPVVGCSVTCTVVVSLPLPLSSVVVSVSWVDVVAK